jgi:hypothetical protein
VLTGVDKAVANESAVIISFNGGIMVIDSPDDRGNLHEVGASANDEIQKHGKV